jgi:hypothetical protein
MMRQKAPPNLTRNYYFFGSRGESQFIRYHNK